MRSLPSDRTKSISCSLASLDLFFSLNSSASLNSRAGVLEPGDGWLDFRGRSPPSLRDEFTVCKSVVSVVGMCVGSSGGRNVEVIISSELSDLAALGTEITAFLS